MVFRGRDWVTSIACPLPGASSTWALAPLQLLFQQPQPLHHCSELGLLNPGEKFCEPPFSESLTVTHRRGSWG
jgi:hypothetical protein